MSGFQTSQTTIHALVERKVMPLGAHDGVLRASRRRAWISVCHGKRPAIANRDVVSWAAAQTDKLAEGQQEDR